MFTDSILWIFSCPRRRSGNLASNMSCSSQCLLILKNPASSCFSRIWKSVPRNCSRVPVSKMHSSVKYWRSSSAEWQILHVVLTDLPWNLDTASCNLYVPARRFAVTPAFLLEACQRMHIPICDAVFPTLKSSSSYIWERTLLYSLFLYFRLRALWHHWLHCYPPFWFLYWVFKKIMDRW